MSRKIKKTVASALALAMMAGTVSVMPEVQFASIVQAAEPGVTVSLNTNSTTVKPGETFTVTCDIKNTEKGFNALNAWVTFNSKAFELVSWDYGKVDNEDINDDVYSNMDKPSLDFGAQKYHDSNPDIDTIIQLYSNTENLYGDAQLSKMVFKAREGVSGEFEFKTMSDPVQQNGKTPAAQNRVEGPAGSTTVIECSPTYNTLKIKVDASAPAVTEASPSPSTPASPSASPSPVVTEASPSPVVTSAAPSASPSPAVTEAQPSPSPVVTQPTASSAPSVAPSAPVSADPKPDQIQIIVGNVTAAKGESITVPIEIKNIGDGLSTFQFDYDCEFTANKVVKGVIDGSWTVGKTNKGLQFLSSDGNNITKEGVIGKMKIDIPADAADGVYTFSMKNFEGAGVSKETGKQVSIDGSAFYGVTGTITIGDVPSAQPTASVQPTASASPSPVVSDVPTVLPTQNAQQEITESNTEGGVKGPKVDAGKYAVKAGETFKLKIKVTDNADGFNALNAWLDVNTDIFEVVSKEAADIDDPNYDESDAFSFVTLNEFHKDNAADNITTVLTLYSDTDNHIGDETLTTITLKVKEGTKDGYYSLPFDAVADGGAVSNRIVEKADGTRGPIVLNPTFYGALVQVGEIAEPSVEPSADPTSSPAVTEPSAVPTASSAPSADPTVEPTGNGIRIKIDTVKGEAGTTVKVPVYAENIGDGFSTVQFSYDMDETFKISKALKGEIDGSWTVGKEQRALQFLSGNGNNISKEGKLGTLQIAIPADAKDGIYPITIKDFEGSAVSPETGKQISLTASDFTGIAGKIIIGDVPEETTPAVTEAQPAETTVLETTEATTILGTTEAQPAETTAAETTTEHQVAQTLVTTEKQPLITTNQQQSETTAATTTEVKPVETEAEVTEAQPAETTPVATEAQPAETTPAATEAQPVETTPAATEAQPAETTPAVTEPAGPVKGDVDDNGVVNSRDIIALKRFLLLVDEKAPVNGDVNSDTKINTLDLVHLLKIILSAK